MGMLRFDLESMNHLDGGITPKMFQDAVRRAVKDCLERPGDDRARTVVLQLKLKPVAVTNGNTIDCEGCDGVFQCKTKIPDFETRSVNFGVQNSGDLIFNPDSPRDHRQTTLLEDAD